MNLTLQSDDLEQYNLGLVALKGSMTSRRILDAVEEKLSQFCLSIESDIISIITDGTSVMTCAGKMSPTHQQLCFAHAIQLAVIDVLYPKNKKTVGIEVENMEGEEEQHASDSESDDDEDDAENAQFQIDDSAASNDEDISHEHYAELISKAPKIIKIFRKPLKNEILQKHVVSDFGKPLELKLDTKTRWNSLYFMLERLNKLRNCVKKALIDIKSDLQFEEWELDRLDDLVTALEPLKVTVEALCRRDFDLLQADESLNFALNKLDSTGSAIGDELAQAMRHRITQRRTEASGILQYLHGAIANEDKLDPLFTTPPKAKIAETLKILILRLNPSLDPQEAGTDPAEETEVVVLDEVEPTTSRKRKRQNAPEDELELALKKVKERDSLGKATIQSKTLLTTIKQEMKLFDANGSRGHHLNISYKYLKAIAPTSVESERVFSSSGYLCNKVRSSLSDKVLDTLCFLRSYFQINDSE